MEQFLVRSTSDYRGIVLKKHKYTDTISLLDAHLGHIKAIVYRAFCVSVGDVLSYQIDKRGKHYILLGCKIEQQPFLLSFHDIFFLHHIIEICYYSIPLGADEKEVFDLILFLYAHFAASWTMNIKKIFLFKLILLIGVYTEHPKLSKSIIMRLSTISTQAIAYISSKPIEGAVDEAIDKVFDCAIDLDCMQDIHNWLCFCLAEHPYCDQFKTINYIYRE